MHGGKTNYFLFNFDQPSLINTKYWWYAIDPFKHDTAKKKNKKQRILCRVQI